MNALIYLIKLINDFAGIYWIADSISNQPIDTYWIAHIISDRHDGTYCIAHIIAHEHNGAHCILILYYVLLVLWCYEVVWLFFCPQFWHFHDNLRTEVNLGPVTTGVETYPLGELSVAQDSGWRDLEVVRVDALKVDFKANKYGTGNFSKPSVLISSSSPEGSDEEVKSDQDGLTKLDNGKSTIKALKDLKVVLNFMSCPIS